MRKCIVMTEENSQEFRLKHKDETNYFIEEINQNEIMSKKHKQVCRVLNYIKFLLIFVSTFSGCVLHFCFCFFN